MYVFNVDHCLHTTLCCQPSCLPPLQPTSTRSSAANVVRWPSPAHMKALAQSRGPAPGGELPRRTAGVVRASQPTLRPTDQHPRSPPPCGKGTTHMGGAACPSPTLHPTLRRKRALATAQLRFQQVRPYNPPRYTLLLLNPAYEDHPAGRPYSILCPETY